MRGRGPHARGGAAAETRRIQNTRSLFYTSHTCGADTGLDAGGGRRARPPRKRAVVILRDGVWWGAGAQKTNERVRERGAAIAAAISQPSPHTPTAAP